MVVIFKMGAYMFYLNTALASFPHSEEEPGNEADMYHNYDVVLKQYHLMCKSWVRLIK